jgi:hypothetical protein
MDKMDRAFSRIGSAPPPRPSGKRHQELKRKVASLRELRLIAGKAQADVATALQIKQPSVSKIETQVDMYLSTLRAYVEAIGGELELVIRFRERRVSRFYRLSGALGPTSRSRSQGAPGRRPKATP